MARIKLPPDTVETHELPYDLSDPSSKLAIDNEVAKWINEDSATHAMYWDEWNEVDERLNGVRAPSGMNQTATKNLADANDATISKLDSGKQSARYFASVNRTRPNNESVLGDFVTSPRKLTVNANNPTDISRGKVIQERVKFIENAQLLFSSVYFHLMDAAWSKGLDWIDVDVDPFANELRGKINVERVSCRDFLVDTNSTGPNFEKGNRRIRVMKKRVEDAIEEYGTFPLFSSANIGADTEYDRPYLGGRDHRTGTEYITVYKIQFRKMESRYFLIHPENSETPGEIEQIRKQLYIQLASNPKTAKYVFEGDRKEQYYRALYTRSSGVYDLKWNTFGMWMSIPLSNYYSELRTYPMGDVQVYANLADLLDSVVTVFVQNAKRSNKPIVEADQELWAEFENQIKAVAANGGASPGIKNVHKTDTINSHLVNLVPWILGWIQDSVSKHAASMGELPANQIAQGTVNTLIAKDRQAHGRKDVMLEWTLTTLTRLFVKIITTVDEEPDFFPLMDSAPGKPNYIPINQVWTEDEYIGNLTAMAGLRQPKQPGLDDVPKDQQAEVGAQYAQAAQDFAVQLQRFRDDFEAVNDVKQDQIKGFILGVNGMEYTEDDMPGLVDQAIKQGLVQNQDEFIQLYKPQGAMVNVYIVNNLREDIDLSCNYSIDTDFTSDPQFVAQRSLTLFQNGASSRLDMLRDMRVPDAEGRLKRADDENEALQMAKMIADNPELKQQFINMVQGAGGQKKPASTGAKK